MVEQGRYPEIPFMPHEIEREKRLKGLGRKFQELMDEQGNDTVQHRGAKRPTPKRQRRPARNENAETGRRPPPKLREQAPCGT